MPSPNYPGQLVFQSSINFVSPTHPAYVPQTTVSQQQAASNPSHRPSNPHPYSIHGVRFDILNPWSTDFSDILFPSTSTPSTNGTLAVDTVPSPSPQSPSPSPHPEPVAEHQGQPENQNEVAAETYPSTQCLVMQRSRSGPMQNDRGRPSSLPNAERYPEMHPHNYPPTPPLSSVERSRGQSGQHPHRFRVMIYGRLVEPLQFKEDDIPNDEMSEDTQGTGGLVYAGGHMRAEKSLKAKFTSIAGSMCSRFGRLSHL